MVRRSYRVRFPAGGDHSGIELAGIIDRPDQLDGYPVAVFCHCFTCNKDLKAIVRLSRALADLGIGVLRFDMTGLGGSGGDFSQTNFSTNVADVRSAVSFAQSEMGVVTALLGHSFGGAAALGVAGMIDCGPERVGSPEGVSDFSPSAVVTLAAPSDTEHLAWLLAAMNPDIEIRGFGSVNIGGRDWVIRREMLEDFRRHDLPAAISRIQSPTLLFHSPKDETVGFEHALRIMGLIHASPSPAGPVSMVSLDSADHLLSNRQEDIDFVASATAAFLRRYASPE